MRPGSRGSHLQLDGRQRDLQCARDSGGAFRAKNGQPAFFYGTIVESGKRRFTYLVISPDPLRSSRSTNVEESGRSSADGQKLESSHSVTIDGQALASRSRATIQGAKLEDVTLELNGKEQPSGSWLFVLRDAPAGATLTPVTLPSPSLPANLDDVAEFTAGFVSTTVRENAAVRALLLD